MRAEPIDLGRTNLQELHELGLNPFAVQLVVESLLRHPDAVATRFTLGISRNDCAGWSGCRITLEPVREDGSIATAPAEARHG